MSETVSLDLWMAGPFSFQLKVLLFDENSPDPNPGSPLPTLIIQPCLGCLHGIHYLKLYYLLVCFIVYFLPAPLTQLPGNQELSFSYPAASPTSTTVPGTD